MNNLQKLLSEISVIKTKYDKEREKERFNIFSALHKERDEVNLHSRVISYLLSPISGHGMGTLFTEIFIRGILKISEKDFCIESVEVIPNEFNKSEYKEIDILLINKQTKQSIIIENKIDAKDSNHTGKPEGYNGQLERYYNTIKEGKDEDMEFQCNKVLVFYLTIDKHKPSDDSIGKGDLKKIEGILKCISYDNEIKNWLEKCTAVLSADKELIKTFIQQYLIIVNRMINNEKERLELKDKIVENLEAAKHLIDNFMHVRWHTAHEFWSELKTEIEKKYNKVRLYPEDFNKAVTQVTHYNRVINHGILFKTRNNVELYISGENTLSWGITEPKKWADFKSETLQHILFSSFSTENTFRLIDSNNMKTAVKDIIFEIKSVEEKQFVNLLEN